MELRDEIKACTICQNYLPLGPKPIFGFSRKSRIIIISQAPGIKAHNSGMYWDDPSGNRLREWLGVSRAVFYKPDNMAIVPMGFCYPGRGKSGDLPPRPECAPQWHERILTTIEQPALTLLIGAYAQKQYLKDRRKRTLTETVRAFSDYLPSIFVLPHPSPRNNIWIRKNPWFESDLVPKLKEKVQEVLDHD